MTYASYREHFKVYPEIQDLLSVEKKTIFLSKIDFILCRAVRRTDVKGRHIKFTLAAGTHSIGNFNARVKVAVLQEKQDWEVP